MRTLHTEDFFEFTILPWLIGLLAAFGILTLIINRKWFFIAWTGFFVLFGITAMFDFYRWEYNYGHNLDPAAAIRVPGMSYQPPLIGYKQLLNFGAYSIPDIGGWIFIGVALALVTALFIELRNTVTITRKLEIKTTMAVLIISFTLMSCDASPQPIRIGKDACDFCRMTISDPRFGGELVTAKGKVYKFDDMHCLVSFYHSKSLSNPGESSVWLADFSRVGQLIPENQSFFLKTDSLRSPMGGNISAFSSKEGLDSVKSATGGEILTWQQLVK
jgi:copper chaperone NosL